MQPGDRIQRRQHGAFLPCRDMGRVLSGKDDPSVDLTEICVMRFSQRIRPCGEAAIRER
jgi:hypothetical protein